MNLINKRKDESYGEQITHHITLLAERLDDALHNLLSIKSRINPEDEYTFLTSIDDIMSTKLEMETLRKLLLGTSYDLKAGGFINWYDITEWYLDKGGRRTYYPDYDSNCHLNLDPKLKNDKSVWSIDSSHLELVMMIENLYRNAFEHGATFIDFTFQDYEINIVSDSKKIETTALNSIFDLGFSTKPNGTGVGLSQVKQFLKDVGLDIKVSNKNDLVHFDIYRKA